MRHRGQIEAPPPTEPITAQGRCRFVTVGFGSPSPPQKKTETPADTDDQAKQVDDQARWCCKLGFLVGNIDCMRGTPMTDDSDDDTPRPAFARMSSRRPVLPIAEQMIGRMPELVLFGATEPRKPPVDHLGPAARHARQGSDELPAVYPRLLLLPSRERATRNNADATNTTCSRSEPESRLHEHVEHTGSRSPPRGDPCTGKRTAAEGLQDHRPLRDGRS